MQWGARLGVVVVEERERGEARDDSGRLAHFGRVESALRAEFARAQQVDAEHFARLLPQLLRHRQRRGHPLAHTDELRAYSTRT